MKGGILMSPVVHEHRDGDILVSTDPARLDLDTVHGLGICKAACGFQ